MAGRNLAIPDRQIGTLHSQCYQALRGAEIAETAKHCEDWNDRFPHYAITPITRRNEDPIEEEGGTAPSPPGNKLLSEVKILRGKMVPRERWPGHLRRFDNQWKRWKEEQKLLDFTDLVETALREIPEAPGKPTVIMIDEAQDMDRLEMALAAKWGADAGRLVAAGDPDQCQPPGSMILTSRGRIPIERIDEDTDRLVTWKQSQNALVVQGNGYPLKILKRTHQGTLLRVTCADRTTRCTPDHVWIAKLNDPGQKRRWALSTPHDFRMVEASAKELAQRGRLPPESKLWLMPEGQTTNDTPSETGHPADLLTQAGLDPSLPLATYYTIRNLAAGRPSPVRACNLIPGTMSLPVRADDGASALWRPLEEAAPESYAGPVYCMRVEPHKTYVADGLITHNCLYQWRGSDPQALTNAIESGEATGQVLDQTYRLPRKVHAAAMDWINRSPNRRTVHYRPTEEEGELRTLKTNYPMPEEVLTDARQYLYDRKTVMFLTSCAYMTEPLTNWLKTQGVPFHNPLRLRHAPWNPLAKRENAGATWQRLLDFTQLSENGVWTAAQFRNWAAAVRVKEVFNGGSVKARLEALENDDTGFEGEPCLSWETINALLKPEAVEAALTGDADWLGQRLAKPRRAAAVFPLNVLRSHGPEALRQEPQAILGTINSVKGAEADVVYLFPDLSLPAVSQWNDPEGKGAVYRLFYVGMTRAKESR